MLVSMLFLLVSARGSRLWKFGLFYWGDYQGSMSEHPQTSARLLVEHQYVYTLSLCDTLFGFQANPDARSASLEWQQTRSVSDRLGALNDSFWLTDAFQSCREVLLAYKSKQIDDTIRIPDIDKALMAAESVFADIQGRSAIVRRAIETVVASVIEKVKSILSNRDSCLSQDCRAFLVAMLYLHGYIHNQKGIVFIPKAAASSFANTPWRVLQKSFTVARSIPTRSGRSYEACEGKVTVTITKRKASMDPGLLGLPLAGNCGADLTSFGWL